MREFLVQQSNNLKRTLRDFSLEKPLSDYCLGKCSFIASFASLLRDWLSTRRLTVFSSLFTLRILVSPTCVCRASVLKCLCPCILVFTTCVIPALPSFLTFLKGMLWPHHLFVSFVRLERLNIGMKKKVLSPEFLDERNGIAGLGNR